MKCNILTILIMGAVCKCFSTGPEETRKSCEAATTCKDCLDTDGGCKWCAQKDYTAKDAGRPRCSTKAILEDNKCTDIQIIDGTVQVSSGKLDDTTQVIPKKVTLKLRPGQTQSFTLSVKPAENYPVRLYYLMDMSNSMKDDLNNLKILGTKIAQEIKNITNNFQLAFGSFVDKTVAPFIQPNLRDEPCQDCEPTYGFHHIFDFNKDATLFEDAVGRQKISGNLDTPEGGFDALMQVAVCGDKIWPKAEHSRRIVVFVTDAAPHIAGDGKIGGIVEPNDGQCHLISNTGHMMYSMTNNMDYPSVSQLKQKLKENKVVPIIAVTRDVEPMYKKLVEEWEDLGTGVGPLERDSSNIVDLIRDNYKKISRTVRLNDDSPANIVVKYKVSKGCSSSRKENECTDVDVNQKVDFRVVVTATNCPKNWKKTQTFKITVPGFGDVDVETSFICECECDKFGVASSPACKGNGTYQCGICECDEGRFGHNCECDSESLADTSLCVMPNSTNTAVCSGFGTCVCGKCECNLLTDSTHKISGKYCQCNNFGCDRHDNKICGGRGICKCGKCVCQEAYMGDNCGLVNCTLGKKECTKDGVVCNGHGICDCDQCECDTGYSGPFCEKCVSCPGKCQASEACVLCHPNYKIGKKEDCDKCKLGIVLVNVTESEKFGEFICSAYYNKTCQVYYTFRQDLVGAETVFVENKPRCTVIVSREVPILAICLALVGGIVLVALLLIIAWKIAVTYYDKREFKRFETERLNARWAPDENPLYRPSHQSFKNPGYTGKLSVSS